MNPWPASALSPEHMADLHYMSVRTRTPVTVLLVLAVEALTGTGHPLAGEPVSYCGPHCTGGHDSAPAGTDRRTA